MEIEQVDTLMLDSFNLHSAEPICQHSPSDYLTTNFKFYESDHEESNNDVKHESDVDALWTKAVDNMFKSSRLFNGNITTDEEKENLNENVMENVISSSTGIEAAIEDENGKSNGEFLIESNKANEVSFIASENNANASPSTEEKSLKSDQIVPASSKPVKKQSLKRKHQDLDVNFDLLVSTSFPPSIKYENKKPKLDSNVDERGRVVGDMVAQDGWGIAPNNCISVDYSFDAAARLPSFREAFVPAIKKIVLRTKELKKKRKAKHYSNEKQVVISQGHPKMATTPVQVRIGNELENQGKTGGVLLDAVPHPAALLSGISEVNHSNSRNKFHGQQISPRNTLPNRPNSNHSANAIIHGPNNIKQEKLDNFSSCDKDTHHNDITEEPGKFLSLNSANLKDIEKDIFSFDEGLEMLDLDKDFPLHNISASSIIDGVTCGISNGLSNQDPDWSFSLSHVNDAHEISTVERQFAHIEKGLEQKNAVGERRNNDVLGQVPLASNNSNGVASFMQTRSLGDGMDVINVEPSLHIGGLKQEPKFDILHQMQQNNIHDNRNNMNPIDFSPEIKQQPSNQHAFRNPNTLNGQIIAQQIHQSFGADIFGAHGDNGAKILAKYLAQRGSMRPGEEKPKIDVTSAISSLIGKSFDEQEANQKAVRDNSHVDFINTSDLEHLDFMNEQF